MQKAEGKEKRSRRVKSFLTKKIKNSERMFHGTIDQMVSRSHVIFFNQDAVEFPGSVLFSRKRKSLLYKILNSNIYLYYCDQDIIDAFLITIDSVVSSSVEGEEFLGYLKIPAFVIPQGHYCINVKKIRDDMVIYVDDGNKITVNDLVFTKNVMEYKGLGLIAQKRVIYVEEHIFDMLKKYFTKEVMDESWNS